MTRRATALIILCACVTFVKSRANDGPVTTTTTTTTNGFSSESKQSASRILDIIGSPVLGPQVAPSKRRIALAETSSSPTATSSSDSSTVGETSAAATSPAESSSDSSIVNEISATAAPPVDLASDSSTVNEISATVVSSAESSSESTPVQIVVAPSNQLLGILQPTSPPSRNNDILSQLLPDFIDITNKLEARGVLRGNGHIQTDLIVKSFMPLMRKVMILNAEAEDRSLTEQEVDAINFASKTVGPFVAFGYDISDYGKGFINPALPRNDVPSDFHAQMMVDLLPDLTHIINQVKEQYGGWPGSAADIVNLFIPFARRVVESEARIEGRFITREELDLLRFGEEVVPILMKYAQESFETGESLVAARKYNIVDVVQNAWEKLDKDPTF